MPSGLPSNLSRLVSCIGSELVGGGSVWVGDGGGAGGSAGEDASDGLDLIDVVRELSDVKSNDDVETGDTIGTMVSALFRFKNRPFLSLSMNL